MRVISGTAKGHKLQTPEGLDTRPTTDRVKESLFNIIAYDLAQCKFLDLFSGSGAIGIEALSRGAQKAVFVDESDICKQIIERNLNFTKLYDKAIILKKDVLSAISYLHSINESFDIIFMDPPYNKGLIEPTLTAIVNAELLKKEGYIIIEHSSKVLIPSIKGLKIVREKDYKTTSMTFMVLED